MEVYINARGSTRCLLSRSCTIASRSTQKDPQQHLAPLSSKSLRLKSNTKSSFRDGSVRWSQARHNWAQENGNTSMNGQQNSHPQQHHGSYHVSNQYPQYCHPQTTGLRRTNPEKSLHNKKRVIQMLFVVVLEFFVCWTPLYVINTLALFNPQAVYQGLGITAISFFQLLAYSSSCCNPITYCFMNCGFRKSFLNLFRCFKKFRGYNGANADLIDGTNLGNSEVDSTAMVKCSRPITEITTR